MERSLRLVTYLVPSHPVELYECIAHFLEDELNIKATLFYESRDPIDLYDNRPDPFVLGEADVGFLNPTQYLKMKKAPNRQFELLPVTPVFVHRKNTEERPGYFADIIMHADFDKTVKSFLDLRGCSWAYTVESSLSSSLSVQKLLRAYGENTTFFGNTIKTGNHLLSVKKVQEKQVTAAAVDSTAFFNYKNVLYRNSDGISVLDSIGPLPPYAIVCRKTLDGNFKTKISDALLDGTLKLAWAKKFEKFGLIKFEENSDDAYADLECDEILDGHRGMSSIYY